MRSVFAALAFAALAQAQTYRGLIGVQIEDADEGSRSRAFVDLGKVFRPWSAVVSGTVPLDEHGWPKSDAQTVIFDIRACCPWASPAAIDDPANFHPDFGGTYHLSFNGQATVGTGDPSIKLRDQKFDAATNATTAEVDLPSSAALFTLSFTDTRRTPASSTNTGIANMRVIRPGYARDTGDVFTHEFLDSLAPFSVLRYMGFTKTNEADSRAYPQVTNWSDRHTVDDATQQNTPGKVGFAWEYVIQLANQAGKDVWINIPVSATDDYIRQLALLFKARLNPGLRIYIEHSNEVWNGADSFPQSKWNTRAGQEEGLSNLFRHAKRCVAISNTFRDVFGADAINDRVRVVLAWWTLYPNLYQDALAWIQSNYGPPSKYLYGIAQTHYFNDQRAAAKGDVTAILADMRQDSDNGRGATTALAGIAGKYNMKQLVYEGGPDTGGGSVPFNGNRILANRDLGIAAVVKHDIADNWFPLGGDLYMYFTLSGGYSRYGTWGAVEDIANLETPKYKALLDLIGPAPAPTVDAIVNAASSAREIPDGGFFSIYGAHLANSAALWDNVFLDGVSMPTALNGVRVQVNGRDAYVSYASATQVNAVAPPGVAAGDAAVEIVTPNGRITTTATVAPVSPAFFPCASPGPNYACAILPLEPGITFVAPPGAYTPYYQSRPAKPGDIVELFATGLGGLGPDFPVGKALSTPYAIDKSKIKVTVAGVPAEVQYAGAIFPGEYQINVVLGDVPASGDAPIVITAGDRTSAMQTSLAVAVR